jgi:hypothetical protein
MRRNHNLPKLHFLQIPEMLNDLEGCQNLLETRRCL